MFKVKVLLTFPIYLENIQYHIARIFIDSKVKSDIYLDEDFNQIKSGGQCRTVQAWLSEKLNHVCDFNFKKYKIIRSTNHQRLKNRYISITDLFDSKCQSDLMALIAVQFNA